MSNWSKFNKMICVVEMKLGELILLNGIKHETIDIQKQYTVSILTAYFNMNKSNIIIYYIHR